MGFNQKQKHEKWLASVVRGIADPDQRVRWSNMQTIKNFGITGVDMLFAALNSEFADVRGEAALGLGAIADLVPDVIPRLIDLLNTDTEPEAHIRAARALGRIKPGVEEAVQPILSYLGSDSIRVRFYIVDALRKMGNASAIGPLKERLSVEQEQWLREQIEMVVSELAVVKSYRGPLTHRSAASAFARAGAGLGCHYRNGNRNSHIARLS